MTGQQLAILVNSLAQASEQLRLLLEAFQTDERFVWPVREVSRVLNDRRRPPEPAHWVEGRSSREMLQAVDGLVTAVGTLHAEARRLRQELWHRR